MHFKLYIQVILLNLEIVFILYRNDLYVIILEADTKETLT